MAKTYMRTERMVCRKYMGKGVWKIMVLKITAYVIIPVYTLLFVSGTNWMTLNLSVIGNRPERQAAFLGLGLILGFYYHWVLERLLTLLPGETVGTPDPACRTVSADSGGSYTVSPGRGSLSGISSYSFCFYSCGTSFVLSVFDGMEAVWVLREGETYASSFSHGAYCHYRNKRSAFDGGWDCQYGTGSFFYSVYDSDGPAALGTFTRYVKIPFFSEW